MKNTNCTLSERLKKGGFPQPKLEIGQVWWNKNHNPYTVIGFLEADAAYVVRFSDGLGKHVPIVDFLDWTFAPTAIDILAQLGIEFTLSPVVESWMVSEHCDLPPRILTIHEKEVEACAEAYFLYFSSIS